MFNERLHQRLDGEEVREVGVPVLKSQNERLHRLITQRKWEEPDGLRYILAAGLRAIEGWTDAGKPLDKMGSDEKLRFLQDRLSTVNAAYSLMQFQAY